MRNKLISGLAIAVFSFAASGLAFAADMPVKAPPPPPPPPCNWCGLYIGLDGGAAFSPSHTVVINETDPAGALDFSGNFGTLKPSGGFGGGEIGYNWQSGAWVFGWVADIQGASIKDSQSVTAPFFTGAIEVATSENLDWFGTVRARLGWENGPLLLYATGGFAYGDVRYSVAMIDTFGFSGAGSANGVRGGYSAGGGFEYMFAPKWSAAIDYQYINLGNATANFPQSGPTPGFAISNSIRFDYHTFRVGLNYQL